MLSNEIEWDSPTWKRLVAEAKRSHETVEETIRRVVSAHFAHRYVSTLVEFPGLGERLGVVNAPSPKAETPTPE
ncbi:MAG: hypothetical protein Fur0036_02420 [Fimbriimonadaceae bacterium]